MAKVTIETMTQEHVKAARALLRWNAADLAERSGIGAATVRRFESGRSIQEAGLTAIFDALTDAGVVMGNGGKPSVSLKHTEARK